ncbi:MAG: HAD-IA family hydrolase [Thermomicrobiales bacterium]
MAQPFPAQSRPCAPRMLPIRGRPRLILGDGDHRGRARKIGLRGDFAVLQSAEHEPYGKPHPAVYIECARRLGVSPANCLALEDSPAGVLAAKAAKMTCIAIPPHELRDDHRYCIADLQLDSIELFTPETIAALDNH